MDRPAAFRFAALAALFLGSICWLLVRTQPGEVPAHRGAEPTDQAERGVDLVRVPGPVKRSAAPREREFSALERGARNGDSPEHQSGNPGAPTSPIEFVRGRVLTPDGQPIEGALVLASNEYLQLLPIGMEGNGPHGLHRPWARATTGADGRFAITSGLVDSKGLSYAIFAPPYTPYRVTGKWIYRGRVLDLGDTHMQPGVDVKGRVENELGQGVDGATVLLAVDNGTPGLHADFPGRGIKLGTSAEDGTFLARGLPPGHWTLYADKAGYAPGELSGSTDQPGVHSGVILVMAKGLTVEGRVERIPAAETRRLRVASTNLAPRMGRATTGAALRERTAEVESGGAFRLEGLPGPGPFRLRAQALQESGAWVDIETVAQVQVSAPEAGALLAFREPTALRARCVDGASGEPITGFDAYLSVGERERPLTPPGWEKDSLVPLPDGVLYRSGEDLAVADDQALVVRCPGFLEARVPAPVEAERTTDLGDVALTPGPAARNHRAGRADRSPGGRCRSRSLLRSL